MSSQIKPLWNPHTTEGTRFDFGFQPNSAIQLITSVANRRQPATDERRVEDNWIKASLDNS